MNKTFKKFLFCLLSLTLLISICAVGAFAASTDEGEVNAVSESNIVDGGTWGGIDWTLTSDGTLTIAPTVNEITKAKPYSKTNPKELYQVGEVPAAVNDTISSITGWPFDRAKVKTLVIEEGVTSIGSFALQGLTNLTGEVVIPSTVTYIGQEAFQKSYMTKLTFAKGGTAELCIGPGAFKTLAITDLVLPADRSSIHIHCWAFNGCSKLENITIPANVDFSTNKSYGWTHAEYEGMDYVYGKYASSSDIFASCPKIKTITFGSEDVKEKFFDIQGNEATINKLSGVATEVKAPSVAMIGEQGYETLEEALAAATAGQTITLVADINENVTISKNLTIDGAGFKYTGTITMNGAKGGVIENVNFVKGNIYVNNSTAGGDYTIKNCTFDGQDAINHAIQCARAYSLTVEECTAKDYVYSFIYVNLNTATVNIKDVTVENVSYATRIVYGNTVNFENVTVKNANYGLVLDTKGEKNVTVRNCVFAVTTPIYVNGTAKTDNLIFAGVNELDNDTLNVAAFKSISGVQIGTKIYGTLAEAIKNAADGQTITLLANVNENVTINKSLTIDGNGKSYTGKMTVNSDLTVTVKNAHFVNGGIEKSTQSSKGVYTIQDCTFDGQGTYNYPLVFRGANKVVVKNCSVKNYVYSFLYIRSSTNTVTVTDVTVEDCPNYAIYFASGVNSATIEGLTVKNSSSGLIINNTANRSLTIKNCTMENVETAIKHTGGTNTITCTVDGKNTIGTAKVSEYVVLVGGLWGFGTEDEPYQIRSLEDLILFRDSVNAGETTYNAPGVYVVLTADIDLASVANWAPIGTFDHSFDGNFNGNGKKIMNLKMSDNTAANGYAYLGFFGVTANNTIENFVIENVTINSNGQIVAAAIAYPYYTTVKDITVCGDIAIKGGNYTAGVLGYTRLCVNASNLSVAGNAGSCITGAKTVGGVIADIQMNGGLTANYSNFSASGLTITGDMHVGGIAGIIANQTLNGATVKNVKLVCSDARVGIVAGSLGGTATIKNVETSKVTGTKNIVGADFSTGKPVANKGDEYGIATAWINKVGYFITLADAVEYVNDANKTSITYIELLCDSKGPGFVVKAPVQIEFEGYTYTITSGVGSNGTESNGIQQLSGKLILRNGTLKVADSIASTMYILIQSYDDLTVTGMILDGTNLDKWSKHEDQVVNGDSYVVSKNNGNFAINTSNIITNNDGSKAFAFDLCDQRAYGYMDLPYASVAATTTINGVSVKESLNKVEAAANYSIYYYATIEQAIAKHPSAALIGDVVLKDTVVIPEGKTFTLDLNGHTITMETAEYKSAIENNGTLTIKDSGENGGIAMTFTGTPSTAKAVNTISNRGKLTVQGGNISNTGRGNQIGYAIDNYNGATLTVKGGNITASGSSYYDAIRLFCGSKETKVTVSGGYVSSIWAQNPSANKASEVKGSVVVTGGEIGTIYYENYTTVTITTKIAGNYNVVAYGANSENATSAKVAKNTVYSFAN